MELYWIPIKVAVILFPFLAAAICIPYAIYNYRKYGVNNKFKIFIFYTFIFYMLTAFFMTLLPLPDIDKPVFISGRNIQLIPFTFLKDFLLETKFSFSNPNTYLYIFSEPAFMQVFFNLLLILPLGIYLRYYFKKSFKQTLIITFLVSLFFEITQLTGIYGIYKYPYRVFDVDDLIINTLGGIIGYFITPLFKYMLPDINIIKSKNFNIGKYSTYPRRLIAFFIDWNICFLFFDEHNIFTFIILTFLYFILIPYFTNGFTVGKYLLKMQLKGNSTKLKFSEILQRYSVLLYGYFLLSYILNDANNYLYNLEYYEFLIIILGVQILLNVFVFLHLISHIIKKDPLLLHDRISGVKNINIS
ncbi:VanZ family protein [Clostridium senegalense]|uniref:VanZ family protein n=1 Tax=Clostridium senegalense TaxID=1465809 RepID=A0A6M0H453_9CLOT|nr:VanZ family protein [Clostridium senegalense]NEU05389.1 VanZ family protein [Clostridium senegalense]